MKLTPKQERFVDEYLIDLNASAAAIRAGYSKKTADVIGHENLRKPNIQLCISKRLDELKGITGITQERILNEYAKLAFFDPRKLYDKNGKLKPIHDLDDDTAAAITGIDLVELAGDDSTPTAVVKKIKHSEKKGALDSLAKYFGMFQYNLKVQGEVKVNHVMVVPGIYKDAKSLEDWEATAIEGQAKLVSDSQ